MARSLHTARYLLLATYCSLHIHTARYIYILLATYCSLLTAGAADEDGRAPKPNPNLNPKPKPKPKPKPNQARLTKLDVPFLRPDDYFAEMLKTDQHMAKVYMHICMHICMQICTHAYVPYP